MIAYNYMCKYTLLYINTKMGKRTRDATIPTRSLFMY